MWNTSQSNDFCPQGCPPDFRPNFENLGLVNRWHKIQSVCFDEIPDAKCIWWFNISWLHAHLWRSRADEDWNFKCDRLPLQACWSDRISIIRRKIKFFFYARLFPDIFFVKNGIFFQKWIFSKKNGTPLMSSDSCNPRANLEPQKASTVLLKHLF